MMDHHQSCFVNFENRQSAEKAIHELYQNIEIKDIPLKIDWARPPDQRITVKSILKSLRNEKVVKSFEGHGKTKLYNAAPPKMPPPEISNSL